MPKIVREKSTQKTVYRQEPDFEEGLGIKNACIIHYLQPKDLEEVEITQEEYDNNLQAESQETVKENMIRAEMDSILRQQAIQSLKDKGLL